MPNPLKSLGNKLWGDDSKHEVPNAEMGRFTAGVFGQNLNVGLVSMFTFLYCVSVLYIDAWIVGTVLGAFRVFDALTDFVGGTIMDKKVFKNGEKFRPVLKYIAIPVGALALVMFLGIGYKPNGDNTLAFVILMIAYFFYSILYTFQDIAQWGMCSVAATTSEERGRMSQWGRTGAMLGGLPKELIPIFMGIFAMQHRLIFGVAGVVLGLGGMVMARWCAYPKERVPAQPLKGNVLEPMKLLLKNKLVVLVVLSHVLGSMSLVLSQFFFFQYLVNFNIFGFQISGINSNVIFGIVVGLPSMFAIVFTTKFAKKLGGMKNILIFVPAIILVTRLIAFAIVRDLNTFNTAWGVIVVGAFMMIGSTFNNMEGVAMTTLWGDSLDLIEYKTGKRNEASVFAMQNLVSKVGVALGTFFGGLTLSLLNFNNEAVDLRIRELMRDYDMSQVEATRHAVDVEGILSNTFMRFAFPVFLLGPALGALFKIIPLIFIKYNAKQQKEIELALKERKALALATAAAQDETVLQEETLQDETLQDETLQDEPLQQETENQTDEN
jgi:GPH family glycoside/pentoside/hexuronide:cation symporter